MSQAKYVKKIDSGDGVRIEHNGGGLENSKISFERRRSRQEKVLLAMFLVVLVVAIVFVVLYAWQVTRKNTEEDHETLSVTKKGPATTKNVLTTKNPSAPSTAASVCSSPDCVLTASGTQLKMS